MQNPLLQVENLKLYYSVRGGGWWKPRQFVRAVDDVSFTINPGETVGLVGESGCGKSSLGRTIVRLENATGGRILFNNRNLTELNGGELRASRKHFQMIFQDPYGSLNPRLTVRAALNEVLALHFIGGKNEREKRAAELLQLVGLEADLLSRYPHQFSGGQRQRIGIARALAAEPELIVADEPVSALDVSVQAQIINLLQDIQRKIGTAFLFIAHDLAVVQHISQRILVMYLGRIVESGPAAEVCGNPKHPYTKALLSAVPKIDRIANEHRIVLSGDVPSPLNPPNGCAFHPRCPFAMDECKQHSPVLSGGEHQCACHLL